MSAVVSGPGSANVSWSLAYSGGLPVQHFLVEYRRNDTPIWRRARAEEAQITNSGVPPERRFHIVRGLESDELYEFRVAASNEFGTGDYQNSSELLLSHEVGVPSPPSRPRVTSWKEGCATIDAKMSKFGSRLDFSLGYILILNDTQASAVVGIDFPGNYTLGEEVEIEVLNVSYRGDWRFAMLASNYLGSSLPSEYSLKGECYIDLLGPIYCPNLLVLLGASKFLQGYRHKGGFSVIPQICNESKIKGLLMTTRL